MSRLGEVELTGVRAEEESLEEIFLEYYGDDAARDERVA
jgi:hypothetical protein